MPTPASLETRVAALETLNRRLVAAVLVMGVLLFALFTLALVARAEVSADCDGPAADEVAAVVGAGERAAAH